MALYIGGADNKAQYVAGMYYGDANNKPARVVAAWIGDENNKPQLFYSPNITFSVDAYGADWYGGTYTISITNVKGGTGRYRYRLTFTEEGSAPLVYQIDDPTRDTSCSYTFTIPRSGAYATWEATVTDAASSRCYGTRSGRFDVVAVAIGVQRYRGTIYQWDHGYWLVTIYSNVLKELDFSASAKASVEDSDGREADYAGTEYDSDLESNVVTFLGNRMGTYSLTSLTVRNSRGISATVSSNEAITVIGKTRTVYNVANLNGSSPDIYNSTDDDTPSGAGYAAVYNVTRLNSNWYHFDGCLGYDNGEWWDYGSCGDQYIKASDFNYSIDSSWTVYYE